jgi:hypothetical protein
MRFLENLAVENSQKSMALEAGLLEHPAMLHGATYSIGFSLT